MERLKKFILKYKELERDSTVQNYFISGRYSISVGLGPGFKLFVREDEKSLSFYEIKDKVILLSVKARHFYLKHSGIWLNGSVKLIVAILIDILQTRSLKMH